MDNTRDSDRFDDPLRLYLLGLTVLMLTAVFANVEGLVGSPHLVLDVPRPSPFVERLHVAGFFLQIGTGLGLALTLLFGGRLARRLLTPAWLTSVCLFLAPLPNLQTDWALAPALMMTAGALAALSWALQATNRSAVQLP